jgi:hypothetical protein
MQMGILFLIDPRELFYTYLCYAESQLSPVS